MTRAPARNVRGPWRPVATMLAPGGASRLAAMTGAESEVEDFGVGHGRSGELVCPVLALPTVDLLQLAAQLQELFGECRSPCAQLLVAPLAIIVRDQLAGELSTQLIQG